MMCDGPGLVYAITTLELQLIHHNNKILVSFFPFSGLRPKIETILNKQISLYVHQSEIVVRCFQ